MSELIKAILYQIGGSVIIRTSTEIEMPTIGNLEIVSWRDPETQDLHVKLNERE